MRVSNRKCRICVNSREEFKASNIFGEWQGWKGDEWYTVYSYGKHWPMYVYVPGEGWFGNNGKYSVSTSKHSGQARPSGDIVFICIKDIRAIAECGWQQFKNARGCLAQDSNVGEGGGGE